MHLRKSAVHTLARSTESTATGADVSVRSERAVDQCHRMIMAYLTSVRRDAA